MSSPKRYDLFVQTGVELEDAFLSDCENGDWVKFADYERLRDALEKARKYCETCDALAGESSEQAQSMRRSAYAEMAASLGSKL